MATAVQKLLDSFVSLDAEVGRLRSLPCSDLGPLGLVEALSQLRDLEFSLRSLQAAWLLQAEQTDATVEATGRSARCWLVEEGQLAPAEANRRLRLARDLERLPLTSAAFAAAEIGPDHVALVAAACHEVGEEHRALLEAALLDVARSCSTVELSRSVEDVRARLGIGDDAAARAAARYSRRNVQLDETFGGTGSLSGTLTSEVRETVRVALHAAGAATTAPDDERTAGQRRHDALGDIAAFYLAHSETASPETGERPRVVVTMNLNQFMGLPDVMVDGQSSATWDSGARVSVSAARRLACDAGIIPAVLSGKSEVLDLGRATRDFSLAMRRAAKLRDGGRCARHGCSRAIRELHHMTYWSWGGATSLENAVWLCSFHHHLLHDRGWQIARLGPGRYLFTDPAGREHGPPTIQGRQAA